MTSVLFIGVIVSAEGIRRSIEIAGGRQVFFVALLSMALAQDSTIEFVPAKELEAKDFAAAKKAIESRIKVYGYAGLVVKIVEDSGRPDRIQIESKTPINEKMRAKLIEIGTSRGQVSWRLSRSLTQAESEQFSYPSSPEGSEWIDPHPLQADPDTARVLVRDREVLASADIAFSKREKDEKSNSGIAWEVSKTALSKLQKLSDADKKEALVFILDGKKYTSYGVADLIMVETGKVKLQILTQVAEGDVNLFLAMVKNPLPCKFSLPE